MVKGVFKKKVKAAKVVVQPFVHKDGYFCKPDLAMDCIRVSVNSLAQRELIKTRGLKDMGDLMTEQGKNGILGTNEKHYSRSGEYTPNCVEQKIRNDFANLRMLSKYKLNNRGEKGDELELDDDDLGDVEERNRYYFDELLVLLKKKECKEDRENTWIHNELYTLFPSDKRSSNNWHSNIEFCK